MWETPARRLPLLGLGHVQPGVLDVLAGGQRYVEVPDLVLEDLGQDDLVAAAALLPPLDQVDHVDGGAVVLVELAVVAGGHHAVGVAALAEDLGLGHHLGLGETRKDLAQ